jgi:hypothetical protein
VSPGIETLPGSLDGDLNSLILEAEAVYRTAQECLAASDWTCYGREMDALEQILETLVTATQAGE